MVPKPVVVHPGWAGRPDRHPFKRGPSCDDIEATYEELNGRDAEFSEKLTQEHRQRYRSGFRGKRRNATKYNKKRDPTHSCEVDEFATAAYTGVRLFR